MLIRTIYHKMLIMKQYQDWTWESLPQQADHNQKSKLRGQLSLLLIDTRKIKNVIYLQANNNWIFPL